MRFALLSECDVCGTRTASIGMPLQALQMNVALIGRLYRPGVDAAEGCVICNPEGWLDTVNRTERSAIENAADRDRRRANGEFDLLDRPRIAQ